VDDETFINRLNQIAKLGGLKLPNLGEGGAPTPQGLSRWSSFLSECLRAGVSLADPRWKRVSIDNSGPYTTFILENRKTADTDFRVGLQLLLGLLDR